MRIPSVPKRVLLGLLSGILATTTACSPSEFEKGDVVWEQEMEVGSYRLTEEVRYDYNGGFGDWEDYYTAAYTVEENQQEVASFEGDATMWSPSSRMEAQPKQVGDWVAIFSLDQVWIWQEGKETISFRPSSLSEEAWEAAGLAPADRVRDFAIDFFIQDGNWILKYRDLDNDAQSPFGYYLSEDEGKTFKPIAAEAVQGLV